MKSSTFIAGLLVIMLTGCTSVRESILPDGTAGYAIACNDNCSARIAEVCPGGHQIVMTTEASVATFDPFYRSLSVRCTKANQSF